MKPLLIIAAMTSAVSLSQVSTSAQQVPAPHVGVMVMTMMPSNVVSGVITGVRYVSCGSGAQDCQGIFEVRALAPEEMPSGAKMPTTMGHEEWVTGKRPITVIFTKGTPFMWQGSPFPLTRLKAGDRIVLGYRTLEGMNVVVGGLMLGMGRM